MKKFIIINLALMMAGLIYAQVSEKSQKIIRLPQYQKPLPYDGKTFPPIKLDEAYAKALTTLGNDTNQFYCVSATCLALVERDGVLGGLTKGWKFIFSSTNGTSKNVCVYFDKTSAINIETQTTQ